MITLGNYKADIQHAFDAQGRNTTVAQIFTKDNKLIKRAKTTCSKSDTFSKKIGRKLAISKALTDSPIPKAERKVFWEDYRTAMTTKPRW